MPRAVWSGYDACMEIAFNQQELEEHLLALGVSSVTLECRDVVTSTSDLLLANAANGGAHGHVLIAEQQTAGRGRGGRQWQSPRAGNLYLSVAWRLQSGLESLSGLSLAIGVAVAEAIQTTTGVRLGLKWPNDIVHERGKVGGVLVETASAGPNACTVVVGVGLNLVMPAEVGDKIDQPWTQLATLTPEPISREWLAADLIRRLIVLLKDWSATGFEPWRDAWLHRDTLYGRQVQMVGARPLQGIAAGIDSAGGLLVRCDTGIEAVHAGEARLSAERQTVGCDVAAH